MRNECVIQWTFTIGHVEMAKLVNPEIHARETCVVLAG